MSNLPSKTNEYLPFDLTKTPIAQLFIEKYLVSYEFNRLKKSTRSSYINEYKIIMEYLASYKREDRESFHGDVTVVEFLKERNWSSPYAPANVGGSINVLMLRIRRDLKRSDASMFKMGAAMKSAVGNYFSQQGLDPLPFKSHIMLFKQPKSDGMDPWPIEDIKSVIDAHSVFLDNCFKYKGQKNILRFLSENEMRIGCVIVAMLFFTGQRVSDACEWREANILNDESISFKQTKTGKEMVIPIHPVLKEFLYAGFQVNVIEGKEVPRNRNLITGSAGKLSRHKAWAIVDKLKKELGIEGRYGLHGLRKSTAIEMIKAGATVEYVKSITGHRSVGMVEHYAKKKNQADIAKKAISFLPSL